MGLILCLGSIIIGNSRFTSLNDWDFGSNCEQVFAFKYYLFNYLVFIYIYIDILKNILRYTMIISVLTNLRNFDKFYTFMHNYLMPRLYVRVVV